MIRPVQRVFGALLPLALVCAAACQDCGSVPSDDDSGTAVAGDGDGDTVLICTTDDDCPDGWLCEGGLCDRDETDAGGDGDGDGDTDGGEPPVAILTVLPDDSIEFGAQLLGVPVVRQVQLQNSGTKALTLLAIILDQDGDEFAVEPSGTLGEVLEPGDVMLLEVSHTPIDATPDTAELKVLHDGQGNIATIELFAEFKGNATFSITDDLAVLEPSLDLYAFGEVETGVPQLATLWLRNVGASDSIVEITDLTLTPPTAGFTLVDEPDLPWLLGAWSTGLCPGDDVGVCPPGATACTDQLCVDDNGDPVTALPLTVQFLTQGLPAQATLTVEFEAGDGAEQHDLVLTGLPTQPELVLTPSEVAFGAALVDSPTPLQATVEVSNTGAGPLLVTLVELPVNPAFSVVPSAPIPTQAGHPPLVLQNGDAPLILTVTFEPSAAEGYAGFLTLHTNDADDEVVPVALSGTGVVCQANAQVNPVSGACECSPGFNDCGGACLADSPTSCGSSCTDCTAVLPATGTDASCGGGVCEYSCDNRYFDLDHDLDTNPNAAGWDGCEYLCPSPLSDPAIAACQADPGLQCETCNGVDDDCDGQRDEGMNPDSADQMGTNGGACTNFTNLGDVDATANGATNNWNYSIYPTGDDDWFKITVNEGLDSPSCIEEVPCIDGGTEAYRTRFQLTSPGSENFTLEVRVPNKANGNYDNCSSQLEPTLTGTDITHNWSRSSDLLDCVLCGLFDIGCYPGGYGCAFNDRQVYFVRVKAAAGTPNSFSCENYTLTVTTTALP